MTNGAGELGFPAADNAGDHRLAEIKAVLVIAAGLGIKHRGLAAVVVLEGVGKIARSIVDIDVLAGGDQRGRTPAFGREVLRNRRGEAAGIRKDRDGAFDQRFLGKVAAKRATNADAIPGIRDAEAIGPENIDAVRLAERTDLARIMHRDFLGDDDDFLKAGIDADQLGDAIAHARWRQIDDAGIEGEAVVEAFAHIVVDRDVALCRRQDLAAAAG